MKFCKRFFSFWKLKFVRTDQFLKGMQGRGKSSNKFSNAYLTAFYYNPCSTSRTDKYINIKGWSWGLFIFKSFSSQFFPSQIYYSCLFYATKQNSNNPFTNWYISLNFYIHHKIDCLYGWYIHLRWQISFLTALTENLTFHIICQTYFPK